VETQSSSSSALINRAMQARRHAITRSIKLSLPKVEGPRLVSRHCNAMRRWPGADEYTELTAGIGFGRPSGRGIYGYIVESHSLDYKAVAISSHAFKGD